MRATKSLHQDYNRQEARRPRAQRTAAALLSHPACSTREVVKNRTTSHLQTAGQQQLPPVVLAAALLTPAADQVAPPWTARASVLPATLPRTPGAVPARAPASATPSVHIIHVFSRSRRWLRRGGGGGGGAIPLKWRLCDSPGTAAPGTRACAQHACGELGCSQEIGQRPDLIGGAWPHGWACACTLTMPCWDAWI